MDFYWMYGGIANEAMVDRFIRQLPLMMRTPADATHHLALQSSGGLIGDGVWLYNFFRGFPRKLTVYNTGTVASIATIAFLGASKRVVSKHAAFMIHRSTFNAHPPTAKNLAAAASLLKIEDARTEAILRERATLTNAQWGHLNHHDLWLIADEAVAAGIADEIGDFAPPAGGNLLMI
jgi:ATP-dependent protease ClpP protease subunit